MHKYQRKLLLWMQSWVLKEWNFLYRYGYNS